MRIMKPIFIIAAVLLSLQISAQQDMTIYHMQSVPQSNYSNPAIIPAPKWHLGFPALSSIYIDAGHTGFNAHHFMKTVSGDSVEIDLEKLVDKMGKYNYLNFNSSVELLSFGFKIKEKHYVHLAASNKMFARFCYPKELFNFIYQGNGAFFDETVKFDKMGINAAHYNELLLGYSMKYNDQWSFGVNVKILQGLANIHMKKSEVTFLTEEEHFFITATSDINVNASLPETAWEEDTLNQNDFEFGDYISNFSNLGVGIDLGATYKFNDKLTLGLSVIDLGMFKWKSGTRNFTSTNPGGSFTFEGIDITDFISQQDTAGAQSKLDNLMDSIADIFQIDTLYEAYTSPLNTRIYLSAAYDFTPKDQLNALLRLHFYNRSVHPAFTLGYQRKFGHILSLSASYTMASRKYFNLGIGLAANLGPIQIYVTTDNIISPFFQNTYHWIEKTENDQGVEEEIARSVTIPRNTKFFNAHFGINFVFGYKPPKETAPMIY
jgi:hypothetical protein